MAKGSKGGTTILLGLKDYRVEKVVGNDERVIMKVEVKGKEKRCPSCGSTRLYGHGINRDRYPTSRDFTGRKKRQGSLAAVKLG